MPFLSRPSIDWTTQLCDLATSFDILPRFLPSPSFLCSPNVVLASRDFSLQCDSVSLEALG